MANCERRFAEEKDHIFPPDRRFDSTKKLVDYIFANEDTIEELLSFLVTEDEEEIATLATQLASSLATCFQIWCIKETFGCCRSRYLTLICLVLLFLI